MILGTNETTRKIDSYAIEKLKIPSILLMENAAISFIKNIDFSFDNFLVFCGPGNNGGDAFAIARQLHSKGKKVVIFYIEKNKMSSDCKINFEICKNLNIDMFNEIEKIDSLLINSEVIIDGIFGTGLNNKIIGIYNEIIEKINKFYNSKKIYSIDIPSGINGTTGEIFGISIKAHKTISFITYKKGFLNLKNREYFGEIIIENIGFDNKILGNFSNEFILDKENIKFFHKKRKIDAHKGNFGRGLIFSGNLNFSGASKIVSNSAIRSGIGLLTLLTYKESININQPTMEVMIDLIDKENLNFSLENIKKYILNSDVIALGPGIGNDENSLKIMESLVKIEKNNNGNIIKLVIDADGINLLSKNKELFKFLKNRTILTPHLGEFSRLVGMSIDEIENNKFELTKTFAKEHNIIILLKGKNTIITDGDILYVNNTGNSHMSNGGMGDSLTGIIMSLIGQKYEIIPSACIASYLQGYIADELLKKQYIINPTHIIENIPLYLNKIFK